jgi:DNA polymerase-3 subunit gamma/tau
MAATAMAAAAPATVALAPAPRPEAGREPPPVVAAAAPRGWSIESFAAVVDLAREEREAILYGHLIADVHLVRFAPPQIEIRMGEGASADLVRRLREFLGRQTGQPWLVTVSHEPGEPTLLDQRRRLEAERRLEVAADPLVKAVLAAFPGARLGEVRAPAPAAVPAATGEGVDGGDEDAVDGEHPGEADGEDLAAEDDVGLDD